MTSFDLSLYLVLDPRLCRDHGMVETARAAVAGGATMVQLRHKTASTAERIAVGHALKAALAGTGVPVIVNDDVEAALACDADGLHIGQGDLSARRARERIGADRILGVSVETPRAAATIDPDLVDYAGAGPVFATATKPDHDPSIGFDGLARLVSTVPVPVVAIGGLKDRHAGDVLSAGAAGMAVVSAICGRADPRQAAHAIAKALKEAGR